jgi:hypothetical protein
MDGQPARGIQQGGAVPHDMAAREDRLPVGGLPKIGTVRRLALLGCHGAGGQG